MFLENWYHWIIFEFDLLTVIEPCEIELVNLLAFSA
jgi:hypothetical protein